VGTYGPGYQQLAHPVRPPRSKPLRHLPPTWTRPPQDGEGADRGQRLLGAQVRRARAAASNGYWRKHSSRPTLETRRLMTRSDCDGPRMQAETSPSTLAPDDPNCGSDRAHHESGSVAAPTVTQIREVKSKPLGPIIAPIGSVQCFVHDAYLKPSLSQGSAPRQCDDVYTIV
jgi:hypothetical protein